jgi:hypothetical protein
VKKRITPNARFERIGVSGQDCTGLPPGVE